MTQSPEQNKKTLFSVEKEQEICSQCAGRLVIKSGQRGPFLGCENYPNCDFTRPLKPHHESSLIRLIPEKRCPGCGAELAIKQGRFGMFISCSDYPKCDYIVRDTTSNEQTVNGNNTDTINRDAKSMDEQNTEEKNTTHSAFSALDEATLSTCYPTAMPSSTTRDQPIEHANPVQNSRVVFCPACKNGHLVKRTSRFGKVFWGCDHFPNCKFIVNETPTNIDCPACGFSVMTYKAERKEGETKTLKCANKRCGKKMPYSDSQKMDQRVDNVDNLSLVSIETLVTALNLGQIISYPTEAVFGLGCDPDNQTAVESLCALKSRTLSKGLILVAANFEQLKSYLDISKLTTEQMSTLHKSWPGPFTWVIPANTDTPKWLTGDFDSIAVRVSAHPTIQALTKAYGKPIVSTSANLTGQNPAKTAEEVFQQFGHQLLIAGGNIGDQVTPTVIQDILTGKVLRA